MDTRLITWLHLWRGFSDQVIWSTERDHILRKHVFVCEHIQVPKQQKVFRPVPRTLTLLTLYQPVHCSAFPLYHFCFTSSGQAVLTCLLCQLEGVLDVSKSLKYSEDKFKYYHCEEWELLEELYCQHYNITKFDSCSVSSCQVKGIKLSNKFFSGTTTVKTKHLTSFVCD